ERFRQEHARLRDPTLVRGAVEFVPVELSEVAPAFARGMKKKKKRHGLRAGLAAAQAAAQPTMEPPEGERLLPPVLLRGLRPQGQGEATHRKARADTPHGSPRIEVEPQSITRSLGLFQEQAFVLDAPAAQQVELVWC